MREVMATSAQELERVGVVVAVVEKRMRQREAAERLGVTQRQVKRLAARYRVAGASGLAPRRRGQRPNNAIAEAKRGAMLELVQQRYADFPPTLAHEKLSEVHGYRLSVETLDERDAPAGLGSGPVLRRVSKADFVGERPTTAQAVLKTVIGYARKAGLEKVTPHDLQRTFVKLAHQGRALLEQIQISLGHASIQTTERYLGLKQNLHNALCNRGSAHIGEVEIQHKVVPSLVVSPERSCGTR